jgi:hypothetical protein
VRLDPLPPAQVVHCDLATKAFEDYADLLFGGVLAPGSRSDSSDKGSGLLGPLLGDLWLAC